MKRPVSTLAGISAGKYNEFLGMAGEGSDDFRRC